ncbi:MAG: trypsin-like serine protease [Myxococcota bacterium]
MNWDHHAWLWLLLAGSACAPGSEGHATVMGDKQAIQGGQVDEVTSEVVAIRISDGIYCTGVVLAPNLLLTARHCFGVQDVGSDLDPFDPATLCDRSRSGLIPRATTVGISQQPVVSGDDRFDSHRVEVLTLEGNPSFPGDGVDSDETCGRDIVALVFEGRVFSSSAYPSPAQAPPPPGSAFSAIGYGAEVFGEDPFTASGAGTRRSRSDQMVTCLGGDSCGNSLESAVLENEWLAEGGAACGGDSGGPALDASGRVIGIVSRVVGQCRDAIYTSVPDFSGFVADAGVYAAGIVGDEIPSWATASSLDPSVSAPVGAACMDDDDCGYGRCIELVSGDNVCSRACDAASSCPVWGGPYTCEPPRGGSADFCQPRATETDSVPAPLEDDGGCTVAATSSPPPVKSLWLYGLAFSVFALRRHRGAQFTGQRQIDR